jgi:xylulokinase
MATYLGLDLGTTAAKGVILSDAGTVIARARVPHTSVRNAGTSRVHPDTWVESIAAVCDKLSAHLPGISAMGTATHCPVMVPLDSAGRAVGAAVSWDEPLLAAYLAELGPQRSPEVVAATGNHPAPSTTVALAYHSLHENDPDAFDAMRYLGFVGTWFGAQLTGVIAADPTQASYSGVFDVVAAHGNWMPAALHALGVDRDVLPPVRDCLDVLGPTSSPFAAMLGIPSGVPVVVGSADTPAAAHALGYAPLLSLGTTHVVGGSRSTPDLRCIALQRRGVRAGEWLVNGVTNGGVALAAAARLIGLTGPDGVSGLIRLAATNPLGRATGAPVFVPHVTPERGPLWLDSPASGLLGLTATTSLEQVARALVDGVVFADRLVLESTLPPSDDPIVLTGSFGDDRSLPQRIADLTGRRLIVVTEPDLPAIGAAAMAAQATQSDVGFTPHASEVEPVEAASLNEAWSTFREAWATVTGVDPASLAAPTSSR